MRKRINYLTNQNKIPNYPIYFTDELITSPIDFIEEKVVNIEGVKPNYYFLNTLGELRNSKRKIIKPNLINSGYYSYRMTNGKKGKERKYINKLAHRLVKEIFDKNSNFDQLTVNHKDMDRSNNRLSNLEYMTQAENNIEKYKTVIDDGTYRYNAAFNLDQLKIIVDELDKGEKQYKEILRMIGIEQTKENCDYIGNIKRGITYKREVKEIRENRNSTTIL